jgi:hypothetical protein
MSTGSKILEYVVLVIFLAAFAFLIKRNRVYVVPFILIIYSNINGLIGWEDFAIRGLLKFKDLGLILTVALLLLDAFRRRQKEPEYFAIARRSGLYNAVNANWFYYIGLLIFSVLLQGELIWPLKEGHTFFFGLVVYVIYKELQPDPLVNFAKIVQCLMWTTLIFGTLYILYNLTGWKIYPADPYEVFNLGFVSGEAMRNFYAFPTFTYLFIFYFTDRLLRGEGNQLLNLAGLTGLSLCVFLMLTRGTLILTSAMTLFLVFYRRFDAKSITRLVLLAVAALLLLLLITTFAEAHYLAMMRRLDELSNRGLLGSANSVTRFVEFKRIVKNVIDFDPLFGFGFTNVSLLGYTSNLINGGSADNGYSNLIGTTGFVGLGFFVVVICCWLVVNLRLQVLKAEHFSKVNFVFILFMLGAMMDGASMSYMQNYALFMAYDLLAFAYVAKRSESRKGSTAGVGESRA